MSLPPPGPHGGDAPAVARALGVAPGDVLDLSQSLNPVAPDPTRALAGRLEAVGRYPDPTEATKTLAGAMGVDPAGLVLTNGGAEAIALVAAELGGHVTEPEFALHPRQPGEAGPRWRSNPHSPSGLLARPEEQAGVWDEAFYPLATGHWTRGDAVVVGSLTKLFACPGLRLGYVLADPALVERVRVRQPAWSVGGLALAVLPDLLEVADLPRWSAAVAALRGELVDLLATYGLAARPSDANWVLVDRGGLREALAPHGVVVRDCTSFGLPDVTRIAVPSAHGLARLAHALDAAKLPRQLAGPGVAPVPTSGPPGDRDPDGRTASWRRPVPLVGDTSSARSRREAPRAWALSDKERDVFYGVVRGRRDIRRFRPDALDVDVLERILGAAHAAPSVGHSQPWRFVVVREAATRERAALIADREWHRQADGLTRRSGRQMLDLTLHGIRDAPVGVVVCCDRRAPARGVLGRATFVDADLWSCACAIENLWLAARAEGVGTGWVTLFRPDELAALVGLPPGVETLGWLCLGWPDERPPGPGLERAGWSTRQPLAEVVVQERWSEDGPPPPPTHLRAPVPEAVVAARDEADGLLTAPASLGVLDRAVDRLAALGLGPATPAVAVIAAASHPVTRHGVSTYADSVTREVVEATVVGESLGAVTAGLVGAELLTVDAGVAGSPVPGALDRRAEGRRGDLVGSDALTRADVEHLVAAGRADGANLKERIVAVGEVGIGNTTVAAALVAARLDVAVDDAVGLGAGGDAGTLGRKRKVVASALERVARAHRDLDEPAATLAALGGPEIAYLSGVILGAAAGGSLVVLDGFVTSAAALVAVELEPAAAAHLVAGQESREHAHRAVNTALGLEPLLSLRLRAGEGVGALLAVQVLRTGAALRAQAGRVFEHPRWRLQDEG